MYDCEIAFLNATCTSSRLNSLFFLFSLVSHLLRAISVSDKAFAWKMLHEVESHRSLYFFSGNTLLLVVVGYLFDWNSVKMWLNIIPKKFKWKSLVEYVILLHTLHLGQSLIRLYSSLDVFCFFVFCFFMGGSRLPVCLFFFCKHHKARGRENIN